MDKDDPKSKPEDTGASKPPVIPPSGKKVPETPEMQRQRAEWLKKHHGEPSPDSK
ncbi:MAG: hypothetical protein ABI693_26540 [Bryobacteraceae bacterium]